VVLLVTVAALIIRARLSVEKPGGLQQIAEMILTNPMKIGIRDVLDDAAGAAVAASGICTMSSSRRASAFAALRPSGWCAATGLAQLPAHRQHRIERRHRLLKNHPDRAAPDLPHLVFAEREEIAAVELHVSTLHPGLGLRQQPHQRQRRHRLAGARFPGDAQRLAAAKREAQLIDDDIAAAGRGDTDGEIADREKRRTWRGRGLGRIEEFAYLGRPPPLTPPPKGEGGCGLSESCQWVGPSAPSPPSPLRGGAGVGVRHVHQTHQSNTARGK